MNRTLKFLMASDVFYFTGFGLVAPIVAIFIDGDIKGGTIFAAGLATTIFIVVKSLVQLPFSRFIDQYDNKLLWLKVGYGLIVLNPFLYMLADHINYVYLAEAVHGFGSGLAYPAWLGLWSAHLDKGHESFEWSLYSTIVGIGSAVTAAVGAAVAEFMGFKMAFGFVGITAFAGFLVLFFLEKKEEKPGKVDVCQYHIKRKAVQAHSHNKRSI